MIHYFYFISAPIKHLLLVSWDRHNLRRESLILESHLFYRNLLEPCMNKEILCLLSIPQIIYFTFLEIIHIALQCYYYRGHFRQSWPIRLQENNNTIIPRRLVVGQSADHKEQYVTQSTEFNFDSKMFHQTIFSYLKPCIQHPGDIFLWQSCYFVFYPQ